MTLPVARDLAAIGVRVNTVAPGPDRHADLRRGRGQRGVQGQPAEGRAVPASASAVPDELASMVVECVTNSYMNAETIRVDGGIRMQPK